MFTLSEEKHPRRIVTSFIILNFLIVFAIGEKCRSITARRGVRFSVSRHLRFTTSDDTKERAHLKTHFGTVRGEAAA